MSIRIFYDGLNFRVKDWRKIKKLIVKVIAEEGKVSGDLNFIITDDSTLLEINKEFLKHNYFTDVISFSNNVENVISGEIYLSLDRIKDNADNYNVSLNEELLRVLIHGTLHLCGYQDQETSEKARMKGKEDFWLDEFKDI